MPKRNPPDRIRIVASTPMQRLARTGGISVGLAMITAAAAILIPSPLHHNASASAESADATHHAETTRQAMANCNDWPSMSEADHNAAAEHLLVVLGHANGDLDDSDYSKPQMSAVDRLVAEIAQQCVPDGRMIARVAAQIYASDASLRNW